MTPVARAQTHISKCRQISHAFFPPSRPFRPPTLPSPQIGEFLFFPLPRRRERIDRRLPKVIFNQRVNKEGASPWEMWDWPGASRSFLAVVVLGGGWMEQEMLERRRRRRRRRTASQEKFGGGRERGRGGDETDGCLENNTSATSEWETWEVRL